MIHVDVLGGLRVADDARVYLELPRQPMRAALLVLLAIDRTLTRDQVLATLWPDRDLERGRRALNQTVYELRRTLGEGCVTVSGEQLAAGDVVQTDARAFVDAVAAEQLEEALELYRGPFLSGFFLAPTNEFEDWSGRHRARLARLARRARIDHIDALVAAGRPAQALPHAVRAVDEDPLEDDYQHRLLQLLVATGQRGAALGQYELYCAALRRQGLTPLDETRALVEALRAQPANAAGDSEGPNSATFPAPPELPPEPASPTPAAAAGRGASAWRRTRWPRLRPLRWREVMAIAATALLVVLGLLSLRIRSADRAARGEDAAPQLTMVLFEDASPESRYGYLARGISESLVHGLQRRVPRLRVVALERGELQARRRLDDRDSGLRLDGTVAVDSDSVRVRVRLSDMATGQLLRPIEVRYAWDSELAVIDSIVPAVIEQMRPILGQQLLRRELRAGTRSAEAFALYLRAADAYEELDRLVRTDDPLGEDRMLEHIDSLLEEADRADPRWARIASLRARTARRQAVVAATQGVHDSPRVRALLRRALDHADAAVSRDPGDADALAGRAKVRLATLVLEHPPQLDQRRAITRAAEADLHRAVSADPFTAEAWLLLAHLHAADGEWSQAHAAALQAWQTDAYLRDHGEILGRLATSAFQLGRDDEAARWCYEGASRFPGSNLWVDCRSHLFAYSDPPAVDSALALVQETQRWSRFSGYPATVELNAARALAAAGFPERARERIEQTRRLSVEGMDHRYLEAAAWAAMGDTARAIRLVREYHQDNPGAFAVFASRQLQGLRSHPDFPRIDLPTP